VGEQDNSDVKLALEEMRFTMQQILSAGDALDQKVNALLVAAGIVLAVSTTLQISLSPNRSNLYWAILFVTIVLYITAVVVVLISSKPYTYRMAIAAKWEELEQHIFGKQERDAILNLLSGYVDQIQHNQKINVCKAKLQMCSIAILALIVVLLVILVFIS
jgi:hypothetical protein